MKTQKFKIEKKILQELFDSLQSLATRIRVISSFIVERDINDKDNFKTISTYYTLVLNYISDIESLLSIPGSSVIITKDLMERLNNYKRSINKTEQEFSNISYISLSIH